MSNQEIKSWIIKEENLILYLESCREFVENDDKFSSFKKDPRYTDVLEHTSYEESLLYMNLLEKHGEKIVGKIKCLSENDIYGDPELRDYTQWGNTFKMSPSTVRYLKNSIDIINNFGTDIKTIAEIGGGYGGLCKTISCFCDFDKYYIFDLPEVNQLSSKYLSKFFLSDRTESSVVENENTEKFDLVISNYAFSELSRNTQKMYIDKVIKKSKYFYITDNHLSSKLFNVNNYSYSYDELCEELNNYDIKIGEDVSYGNKIYYGRIHI